MKHRRAPRRLGGGAGAVGRLVGSLQPISALAEVQRVWPEAVGPALATHAAPTSATGGTVGVSCESAVWAHELTLMSAELVTALNARLGAGVVRELRCTAAPGRAWVRKP